MVKRMFFITVSALLAVSAAACKTDVPVPDDEQAKEWTGPIKGAYPDWQPTRNAPAGNPEYEAMFAQKPAPELKPSELPAPEEAAPSAPSTPSTVRIDVTGKGEILLDGAAISDVQLKSGVVEQYLAAIAKEHAGASMAIIHALSPDAPPAKFNVLLDLCRKTGIAKVKFVPADGKKGPNTHPAGKDGAKAHKKGAGKRLVIVVDETKPATEYIVKPGETLSRIAQKTYKNGALWHIIYKANKSRIKDPNRVAPKTKLTIPSIKTIEAPAR